MKNDVREEVYVRVKDGNGQEFVCPLTALKDPKDLSPEQLEHGVDSGTVGRYAGDIAIENNK